MKGVLLINLGSPNSTKVPDVRKYLREFLMDGRVLDVAWPVRFGVVNLAILPKRPKQSAEAYHKIWTDEGSPLVVTSRRVHAQLQKRSSMPIELAMRYQNPSVTHAVSRLRDLGVDELFLIPLFPHYAMSSYESAVERVRKVASDLAPNMRLKVQPPYYNRPDYIEALVGSAESFIQNGYDHLLFSFHGIPERHLIKSDTTGSHCLKTPNCCETPSVAHETCYRAQCFQTVAAFVKRTTIPQNKYSIAFQSRLGRDPWLKPYTDFELPRLAQKGIKKLLVMCPAFVSDCLETLDEIGMRGREDFLKAGGAELILIPCLNENPKWITTLENMIAEFTTGRADSVATGQTEGVAR